MSLSTIMVGVDFSEQGDVARAHAEALARAHDAEIVLAHASGIDSAGMYVYEVAGRVDEPWKTYVHARLEQGRERVQALADEVRGRGVRARPLHLHGFPDESLVRAAHDVGADLLVVGTHGRTGVERWFLGSVAERVVRLCERDVLVARQSPPDEGRYQRILAPTDFSDASRRALDLALILAAPGATVKVLHCWHLPLAVVEGMPDWLRERVLEDARAEADRLVAEKSGGDVELELELVEAMPAPTLQARLATGDHDCAVLGSHGRRGVRRMVLGSVAEQTIRYAGVPVFVAHGS